MPQPPKGIQALRPSCKVLLYAFQIPAQLVGIHQASHRQKLHCHWLLFVGHALDRVVIHIAEVVIFSAKDGDAVVQFAVALPTLVRHLPDALWLVVRTMCAVGRLRQCALLFALRRLGIVTTVALLLPCLSLCHRQGFGFSLSDSQRRIAGLRLFPRMLPECRRPGSCCFPFFCLRESWHCCCSPIPVVPLCG